MADRQGGAADGRLLPEAGVLAEAALTAASLVVLIVTPILVSLFPFRQLFFHLLKGWLNRLLGPFKKGREKTLALEAPLKLILFDVDGVLLKAKRWTVEGSCEAVREIFGVDADIRDYSPAGKTGRTVLLELCERAGVGRFKAEFWMNELCAAAAKWARAHAAELAEPLAGVRELLESLKPRGCVLGFVTGNVREAAQTMLAEAGIGGFFDVFGTGEASEEYDRSLDSAIAQAEAKYGPVERQTIVYFSGEPADVAAGRREGVFVVGVATGSHPGPELAEAGADAVLPDLSDPALVMSLLGA